jgi:ElaB/YqjD/DUF883 family membrane-anchored ribosome-binding protein
MEFVSGVEAGTTRLSRACSRAQSPALAYRADPKPAAEPTPTLRVRKPAQMPQGDAVAVRLTGRTPHSAPQPSRKEFPMETNTRTVHTDGSQDSSHQLRHMVDEIDTYLRSAADSGDQKFNAVRDKLSVQVREMRAQLDELNQATLARVKRAAQQADQSVQAHPYAAMGIAAATGLLIGFLASRR